MVRFTCAAGALIPANDDEDEELVSKAKANRQKRIVEEKDTEQDFAKSAGYNGVTLLTIERGIKKLAKSGSDLEAGNLSTAAKLARWAADLKMAVPASAGAQFVPAQQCHVLQRFMGCRVQEGCQLCQYNC